MPHQLQETDFSFSSLELRTPQKYLLTSVSDSDPKKNHGFLAPHITGNNDENLAKISKNWFFSDSQIMAHKPLTSKPRKKPCYYRNPSSNHFFERLEFGNLTKNQISIIWLFLNSN